MRTVILLFALLFLATGAGGDELISVPSLSLADSVTLNGATTQQVRSRTTSGGGLAWLNTSQLIGSGWLKVNKLSEPIGFTTGSGQPETEELETVDAWTAPWELPQPGGAIMIQAHPYGDLYANLSTIGTAITVDGKEYTNGLGTHAGAVFEVFLPSGAQTFSASLGIDQNAKTANGTKGSATVTIDTEGVDTVSPVIIGGNSPALFTAPLNGEDSFIIRIGDGGDGVACDQIDLLNAKVVLNDDSEVWLSSLPIKGGGSAGLLAKDLPFRFTYNGVSSREFLGNWERTVTSITPAIRGGTTYRHEFTDQGTTGLKLTWDLTTFDEYPAVDWVLEFENTGTEPLPILENIQALDLQFGPLAEDQQRILRGAQGGVHWHGYQPFEADLSGGLPVSMEPVDGRSSNMLLPFATLDCESAGVVVALGWSGQWRMTAKEYGYGILMQGGVDNQRVVLQPGERFRTARVLTVYWSGTRLHGQNLFRRVLRDHYTPLLNGERPEPIVQCNSWFPLDNGQNATADKHVEFMRGYAGSGLEYLVMDAGWYSERTTGSAWNWWTGSWEPNSTRFPEGLSPIGAAGAAAGIGFGLWFEPERVVPGTDLAVNHPEWLLETPDPLYRDYNPLTDAELLNLGLPEVQDWFVSTVSNYAANTPLAYFRHDFNHFNSLLTWKKADTFQQEGMTETRYVEGLYNILDRLRESFPGMVMEGCASGGRRIDLETLRRSHLYWKADAIYADPEAHQSQLWGGLHWLPGGFLNTQVLDLKTDPYWLHSTFGGSLCVGWDPTAATAAPNRPYFKDAYNAQLAQQQIASFKSVRRLFDGDFFPLTPYTDRDDEWIGWQFHRDDLDEGMAVLFRRADAAADSLFVTFDGIDNAQQYNLRTEGGSTVEGPVYGNQLRSGITVTIPTAPGSILIHYTPVQKGQSADAGLDGLPGAWENEILGSSDEHPHTHSAGFHRIAAKFSN